MAAAIVEGARRDDFETNVANAILHERSRLKVEFTPVQAGKQIGQTVFENLEQREWRRVGAIPLQLHKAQCVFGEMDEVNTTLTVDAWVGDAGGDGTLVEPIRHVSLGMRHGPRMSVSNFAPTFNSSDFSDTFIEASRPVAAPSITISFAKLMELLHPSLAVIECGVKSNQPTVATLLMRLRAQSSRVVSFAPVSASVYSPIPHARGCGDLSQGVRMKVTVRVDVERDVRDQAARQLAEQGLTIDETMRIVLEQAAAGCGPDFGALVPNATTVEAIEAARRGEVVELGTPVEALAELNRDD